jgi:hypothetical protein
MPGVWKGEEGDWFLIRNSIIKLLEREGVAVRTGEEYFLETALISWGWKTWTGTVSFHPLIYNYYWDFLIEIRLGWRFIAGV